MAHLEVRQPPPDRGMGGAIVRREPVVHVRSVARSLFVGWLLASPALAQAQTDPAPRAPAPEAAQDPARAAFEALPEPERRALQDALTWTGDYKGAPDGGYGRGTRDALNAWSARAKTPPGRALDEAARATSARPTRSCSG
ncbi:MAG: Peptidoglycan-binding domain 1 protein [Hyphomicrobiales bacterium]|nr:Peptidoglycan-binding domain 1 protein [Hyphomicrobiales bacterium]